MHGLCGTRPKRCLALRVIDSLRYRQFRLIWYGQVFASMATWMDSIARGWLIYELTNSSFQRGLVGGVQALPILLSGQYPVARPIFTLPKSR